MLPPLSDAAKKKDKQTVPVKIVKASETKFKGAKILRPQEKAKKKGFLWFKKKDKDVVVEKRKPLKKKKAKLPNGKKTSEVARPADQVVK